MKNIALRNIEIIAAREQGEAYTSISKRYELSPERVRQIVLKNERRKIWIQGRIAAPLKKVT